MKKSLIAVLAVILTLPLGCKVEEDTPPDPLAKREGFCKAWAQSACQAKVVEYCNAASVEDCVSTQSDACLGIIPENYSSKHAKDCLTAVKAAYKDGDLTPEEIQVVKNLAAPCDQLSSGTSGDGERCTANDDCNTAAGFACIKKQGATKGSCGKPEEVGPGEACDGPTQVCGEGYFCTGEYCVVYKKTGGVCDGDYQCKPEDHCVKDTADAETGLCQLRADLNETCVTDDDCQSHYCALAKDATEGECASTIRLSRSEPLCETLR